MQVWGFVAFDNPTDAPAVRFDTQPVVLDSRDIKALTSVKDGFSVVRCDKVLETRHLTACSAVKYPDRDKGLDRIALRAVKNAVLDSEQATEFKTRGSAVQLTIRFSDSTELTAQGCRTLCSGATPEPPPPPPAKPTS